MSGRGRLVVAVIGGGFVGAALAYQLARRAPDVFRIVVIEPRPQLGGGLAYSTPDPAHRTNVPASRMTFLPSDPCHFDRWLKADGALRDDPEATLPDGRKFPRRSLFGRYAAETIEPFLLTGEIEHLCDRATAVRETADGYRIELAEGAAQEADFVALAASHPAPAAPPPLAHFAGDPRLIRNAMTGQALRRLSPDARVLIVGCGLAMADIVASLDARGHGGPIHAISRRGLIPRPHADAPGEFGAFAEAPSRTALALLRRVRGTIRLAEAEGRPWQHVMDACRTQGRAIWAALPPAERRRLARRLRPFWDAHRFRVAPQTDAVLRRRLREGGLRVDAARIVEAKPNDAAIEVTIQHRGGRLETGAFDAVALATGPAHRALVETDPLFFELHRSGLVTLDDVGLALAVDGRSRAVGRGGRARPTFWIAGPLARGAFGELMGLPEVGRHAEEVAGDVIRSYAGRVAEARVVA
ncbi:FAD/NAD(P)-binding protein [Hansschlegelia beijingensis]|uniref:Putative NAD(P)/FAD-binding protein YdhS n=1 Tax=Hansschlegelia beijingensis TaxID=1133344 RepID=A0A7W6D091_9HYPH|nr:FAD-dependent oxidoreductase [Hansschlegelia beijingensis]MBB3971985.1 putative NAD(P)/FAD-binding protein YdhS [Hansschlegelia beijingensis]